MQLEYSNLIAGFLNGSINVPDLQFIQLGSEELGNNTIGAVITFPSSWPRVERYFSPVLPTLVGCL